MKAYFVGAGIPSLSRVSGQLPSILADKAIQIIRARTGRGLDVNLRPFRPYSPSYAKKRRDSGLRAKPVNLRVTGRMLDSMRVISSRQGLAQVGWTDDREGDKAERNEELGRVFVGVSHPSEQAQLDAVASAYIDATIRGER